MHAVGAICLNTWAVPAIVESTNAVHTKRKSHAPIGGNCALSETLCLGKDRGEYVQSAGVRGMGNARRHLTGSLRLRRGRAYFSERKQVLRTVWVPWSDGGLHGKSN